MKSFKIAYQHHRTRYLILFSISLIASIFLLILNLAEAQTQSLRISAPDTGYIDYPVEIVLELNNPNAISGYEVFANYDTSVTEFGGVYFKDSDGMPLDKEMIISSVNEDGVAFAVYSCEIVGCNDPREVEKRRPEKDVSDIVFRFLPLQAGQIIVDFSQARFVDQHGELIDVSITDPKIDAAVPRTDD